MTKLETCPFCGEEEFITLWSNGVRVDGFYFVTAICTECGAKVERGEDTPQEAEAKAIEAWNTRAERTCTFSDNWNDPDVPLPTCSECGWEAEETDCVYVIGGPMFQYGGKFCKECGAKVVE